MPCYKSVNFLAGRWLGSMSQLSLNLVHAKSVLLHALTLAINLHKPSVFFKAATKCRIQLLEDILCVKGPDDKVLRSLKSSCTVNCL